MSIRDKIIDRYFFVIERMAERGDFDRERDAERESRNIASHLEYYCYDVLGIYNNEIQDFINKLSRNI